MRNITLLLLLLLTSAAFGQTFQVKGVIMDTAGKPLPGASIKLKQEKDSSLVVTDKTGAYVFNTVSSNHFTLTATYTGFQPFVQTFTRSNNSQVFQVPPVLLQSSAGVLEGVVIQGVRPVLVKEDTVQYDADAYKVREGAPVEDVIKKLPGVTVDKDGNIEAQGKKVARVRVNGKDFFGGDVQTATQNLPAEVIANIQIIDDYGDQAAVTGVKNGDPEKIININTRSNRTQGSFGNATAAAGNEGRYAGSLFVNNFKNDRQMSIIGAINNTNTSLFNFNGGGRGGGARGANFGSDNRGGGGPGITLNRSVGFNYRDKWGQKLSVYGSYSFSSRNTAIESASYSQDINTDKKRNTQRESSSENNSTNHRLTWNMEYAMDSNNYFKVSPYLSYSNGDNWSRSQSDIRQVGGSTQSTSSSSGNSKSPNAGGSLFYNHKFGLRGRNLSANYSVDYSDNEADRYSNSTYYDVDSTFTPYRTKNTLQIQRRGTVSSNTRTNVHLAYAEPLDAAKTTFLEANYDWNKSATESILDVYDRPDSLTKEGVLNERQSNHYTYEFITNRAGLSLRGRKEKYNYSIGFQSQPNRLTGTSVGKNLNTSYSNVNWVPSGRFVYQFARNHSLTATVDGSAREPSFMQLQPVADSSNLNNIVVGNPNLQNEFTNRFALQYNKFDSRAGSSLFVNFSYDRTSDKIVTNRTDVANSTRRSTTYLNTDGFNGLNGNASFNKPFSNRKYTVGANMAASYDNNISYTNNNRNKGQNWNVRTGANFRLDLPNKIDITLRGDYNTYRTITHDTSATKKIASESLNLGVNGKTYFGDLTIGYDFSRMVNYGINRGVNSNPTILNVYTEYRFLKGKMMTVRLQGFDLFNKNTSITHTVTPDNITDTRTTRLARYFLLSLNIRLAKFTAGGMQRGMQGEGRGFNREGRNWQN